MGSGLRKSGWLMVPVLLAVVVTLSLDVGSALAGKGRRVSRAEAKPSETRVALVIGNSAYTKGPLRNPVNDAAAMSRVLERLGFEVTTLQNTTYRQMRRAVIRFGQQMDRAGVRLFFYAGHGVQVKGRNYLIPVDAAISKEAEVEAEGLMVDNLLARMTGRRNSLNIIILDACRDNPYERSFRSGSGQGLAAIQPPRGSVVAFATGPGRVATDGVRGNSPYTAQLIRHLETPGLRLVDVFNRVRVAVQRQTKGHQRPMEWLSLENPVYLAGPPEEEMDTGQAEGESVQARTTRLLKAAEADLKANRLTLPKGMNALEKYRAVLELDPGNSQAVAGLDLIVGRYADLARAAMARRQWNKAEKFLTRAEAISEADPRLSRVWAELNRARAQAAQPTATAPVWEEGRDTDTGTGRVSGERAGDQSASADPDQANVDRLAVEIRRIDRRISAIKQGIESGQGATEATLDKLAALTSERDRLAAQKERLEREIKTRQEKLRQERIARILARARKDVAKYRAIVSSSGGEGLKNIAWRSLAAKYPKAARDLDVGDVDGLLLAVEFGSGGCLINSIGMKFRLIPAGSFMMGSTRGDNNEKPVHRVAITKPFHMSVTEVTQAQWRAVMGSNPSKFKGPNLPVERVSWHDAREFIAKLNARESTDKYRLPSEAEWEYACRAGSNGKWSFGDDPDRLTGYAWYGSNSNRQTHPVAEKTPNAWGLYDMHGNVWEWVSDRYNRGYYARSPKEDPKGPVSGSRRVSRGGSWDVPADYARCAVRFFDVPDGRNYFVGFRCARTLK